MLSGMRCLYSHCALVSRIPTGHRWCAIDYDHDTGSSAQIDPAFVWFSNGILVSLDRATDLTTPESLKLRHGFGRFWLLIAVGLAVLLLIHVFRASWDDCKSLASPLHTQAQSCCIASANSACETKHWSFTPCVLAASIATCECNYFHLQRRVTVRARECPLATAETVGCLRCNDPN